MYKSIIVSNTHVLHTKHNAHNIHTHTLSLSISPFSPSLCLPRVLINLYCSLV